MLFTPMTKKAMKLAYDAHQGQLDRSGIPYILHPARVAENFMSEPEACVAWLQDVVEDTDPEDIWKEVYYRLYVSIGEDGCILDVSRLSAEKMMSESERHSSWQPYPIDESDYESIVDEMMEEILA